MAISPQKARALLKKIATRRVLVIGDVMLDHYVWGDAHRISPEAPVPIVEINRDSYVAGGAANVGVNCAALGAGVAVAGYAGADDAGRKLRDLLKEHRIQTIATPGTGQTIIKTRVILQRQQLCRLDRESAPEHYRVPAGKIRRTLGAAIAAADAVILSDYAKGLLSQDLVTEVISTARDQGKLVALDPKPRNAIAFEGIDLLTPNRREAAELAGIEWQPGRSFPAEEICRVLHERHAVKHLVITLSEDGMLLSTADRPKQQIPTAAREVFDVSGAGDTSIAALVLALSAGADLETAAHFANAAAGVVVGKLGTASVSPAELIAHLSHGL